MEIHKKRCKVKAEQALYKVAKLMFKTLGLLAVLLGVLMAVPGLIAAIYKEPLGVVAFVFASITAIALGIFLKHLGDDEYMGRREAFIIVSSGWFLAAILGAVPYIFLGMGPVDAVFESMSGFTTAGATTLTEYNSQGYWILNYEMVRGSLAYLFVEQATNFLLSHSSTERIDIGLGMTLNLLDLLTVKGTYFGLLFWRSFTQLLGGLSIILLFIAVLPNLGVAGRELYSVEGIGLTKEALTPRVKDTAKTLWGIYLGLVALESLLLIYLEYRSMTLFAPPSPAWPQEDSLLRPTASHHTTAFLWKVWSVFFFY